METNDRLGSCYRELKKLRGRFSEIDEVLNELDEHYKNRPLKNGSSYKPKFDFLELTGEMDRDLKMLLEQVEEVVGRYEKSGEAGTAGHSLSEFKGILELWNTDDARGVLYGALEASRRIRMAARPVRLDQFIISSLPPLLGMGLSLWALFWGVILNGPA